MRSPTEAIVIAAQDGLALPADRLVETLTPGWVLRAAEPHRAGSGKSKIGGWPDLAADECWPANERGVPMTFLAQFACADLPSWRSPWEVGSYWGHGEEFLRIFADLVDHPIGVASAVVMCRAGRAGAQPVAPPVLPDRWAPPFPPAIHSSRRELPELTVTPVPYVGAATIPPEAVALEFRSEHEWELYARWQRRVADQPLSGPVPDPHSLLGPAYSTNIEDVRCALTWMEPFAGTPLTDPEAWSVLLHLSEDSRLEINGGEFTVLMPRVDLLRGDYRRVWCVAQP